MGRMVGPLVSAGFKVVAFDAPAHGESSGRTTDLVESASAIAAVAAHTGPLHAVLAHSFGASMALYAQRDWGVQAPRMARSARLTTATGSHRPLASTWA